jgi:putative ABC transport system ATP-binding protein
MHYPSTVAADMHMRNRDLVEARASGNSEFDSSVDWIDYSSAGAAGPAALDEKILRILAAVELDDDIFEFGLRSQPDAGAGSEFEARVLLARAALKERLARASIAHMVEPFDPARFQVQATIAENLVFGAALDPAFQSENLPSNRLVLEILAESQLDDRLYEVGRRIAATVVELFADLPPDHPFFNRLSFVKAEELPIYKTMLARIGDRAPAAIDRADRAMILGLALGYIEPRHRLNLLTDDIRTLVVAARGRLIERLRAGPAAAVAIYEPDHYNAGSSLEANILFGRIAHGIADAAVRVREAMRETLLDLRLRETVLEAGLGFLVGNGGKRLTQAQRQKLALARALLKKPDVLIVNRGLANLNARNQRAILTAVTNLLSQDSSLDENKSRPTIFWVLASPALVDMFDRVLVFHEGRITADGAPARLLESDKQLKRLVA